MDSTTGFTLVYDGMVGCHVPYLWHDIPVWQHYREWSSKPIFSRLASLARQAFLITPLHGTRSNMGKNAYAKK